MTQVTKAGKLSNKVIRQQIRMKPGERMVEFIQRVRRLFVENSPKADPTSETLR